jgi:hypothetical protein
MRRFSLGWRSVFVAAAVASLILLPISQAFSDERGEALGQKRTGGIEMAQRGEEAPGFVPTYSRANYQWPYAEGPYYGDESKALGGADRLVRTSVGVFDLTKGQPRFPQELKAQNKLDKGPQYFIVQLDPASRDSGSFGRLKAELNGSDGKIVRSMPSSAMIVLLNSAGKAKIESNPDVIAVEPYHAAFKLDPTIGRVPLPDPMKAVSEVYSLEIRVFPGEDSGAVAREIKKLGGSVTATYPDTVIAEIHRSKLGDVAAIEPVEAVFEALPNQLWGEETTTTLQTGRYNAGATPYHDAGIDGGGGGLAAAQVLMILDSGIQLDAGDLSNTKVSAGVAGVGHRKVRFYGTTDVFGGLGDLTGCDAGPSGGYSHGHVVAATALGNATAVPGSYGTGWQLEDNNGNLWKIDGVAKGAKLVAYDAQQTPAATSCADPLLNTISPGDLYSGGATGSLGVAYTTHGARVFNFSWGSNANVYSAGAQDVDQFLQDKGDALVFVAAGNAGLDADNDGVPDAASIGQPATTKNGLCIGASRAANDQSEGGAEDEREFFSSIGPAAGVRIAPQLMSPGGEEANAQNMGLRSEYACRTNDNDQLDPVECDRVDQLEGTSFASPGAAGAALLVRDYFAQGGYPDGTTTDIGNAGDQIANISGALVKAVLIASADYMTGDRPPSFSAMFPGGDGLTVVYRFNNEQGYGRIQLSNALPLQTWPESVSGLRVQDSVVAPVAGGIGLANTVDADAGGLTSTTFNVCNPNDELRIALAWFDDAVAALVNNLNLEVQSPSGKIYRGNYFTDDDNRNGSLDANEDCPSIDGTTGTISSSQWSIPACTRANATPSPFDSANPTEAIMLSPDPLGTGLSPGPSSQIEVGNWTVRVSSPGGGSNPSQTYAIVISGGVCSQSWARLDQAEYTCNQTSTPTIFEFSEGGDVAPTAAQVTARTVMQVVNSSGTVVDTESGLSFAQTPGTLVFTGPELVLTSVTERDSGNGALDARDGDSIRVTYTDTTGVRQSVSKVNCKPRLGFGNIVFAQYGQDTTFFVGGGCERNARGNFEFGFPDRYMDAGEEMTYNFAFASNEPQDLNNVKVDLRCVIADGDSPKDCRAGSTDCADPNRTNNLTCDGKAGFGGIGTKYMSIIDTPKTIGLINGNSGLSANFSVVMEPAIAGTPEVDMVLLLAAATSGKSANSLAIARHTLDVDEQSVFYSTDFPTGGVQNFDISQNRQGDEILQNPVTNIGDFLQDYRFETFTWSDMTAGGTKNTSLLAPWNFDTNDGGFKSGLLATTSESTITNTISQWGEDKNFNNTDDKRCSGDIRVACNRAIDCTGLGSCLSVEDRDPANGVLDKSWNIRGGCGWQTKSPNTCSNDTTKGCFSNADCSGGGLCNAASPTGGIWHTGRIGGTVGNCLVTGNDPGQCQAYETVGGTQGLRSWREHIITPIMQKVNGDNYTAEIVQWRWNQAIELADNNAAWAWEFDTDVLALKPADLFSDNVVLNSLFGPYGAVGKTNNPRLTNGYSMFAPMTANMQQSFNGVAGNNRQGKNSCFFENGAIIAGAGGPCPGCPFDPGDEMGFAGPLDNDLDDNGAGGIDEYVTASGPVRNMDIFAVNGPDMRFSTLEDIYGETKELFQGSIGFWTFERTPAETDPKISYGLGVDDVVVEWREFNLVKDTTNCAAGECAVLDVLSNNTFEGSTSITITALEKTPDAANDCDLNDVTDGTIDCNGNGRRDLVVRATSNTEFAGEIVFLDATATPNQYVGEIPVSSRYDTTPGVLFVSQQGTDNPVVTVTYRDNSDGTGVPCKNDVNPAEQGRIIANTTVVLGLGNIQVIATLLTDNGDNDGFADTNETVNMRLRIVNKTDVNLNNLAARLSTNDPKIDCILDSFIFVGPLGGGAETVTTDAFSFRVSASDRAHTCKGGTAAGQFCPTTGAACGTGGVCGLTDLDPLAATLSMGFAADEFDGLASPQSVTIDLDLDAAGGSGPTTYFEGFESGTFGTFQAHNIDQPLNSLQASDGYRCTYSDPDWPNSNSYGQITDCFLAANQAQADAFFWQIWTPARFGGRAYSGNNSLYMGIWGATADFLTTPVSIMEAVRMTNPINLGVVGVPPELTYKQQVDLLDSRSVNSPPGDAPGRYVTMLQLANGVGAPVGDWIKLEPYLNVYDQQGVDNYFNCMFDPIDDGNDEDDFFDPTDPDRRLGPASMCKPAFSFSYLGETFLPFAENRLGLAEGPGLQGSLGLGTWVETKFNLERFRGRRARLRFINSDLKINGTNTTWASLFVALNPGPGDDGILIDDVQVTNTLTSPATISVDNKANAGLPACGATCTSITAALAGDPPGALTAPGQVVELSSLTSTADRCLDGVLQYRFWIDGNNNGQGGNPQDTLLRNWTDNPNIVDAPTATTRYVVDVRCSTLTTCLGTTSRTVVVTCPTSGAQGQGFPRISAPNKTSIAWTGSINYNFAKGALGNFALGTCSPGVPATCYTTTASAQNQGPASTFSTAADAPAANTGLWYLFRRPGTKGTGGSGFCNSPPITWGAPGTAPASRDAVLP